MQATTRNNGEFQTNGYQHTIMYMARIHSQAEFLFECVDTTIHKTIPEEVNYLQKYDEMKRWLDDHYQMPDDMVALLIRFLEQNQGTLSKRAMEKEFIALTPEEVKEIEEKYSAIFTENP